MTATFSIKFSPRRRLPVLEERMKQVVLEIAEVGENARQESELVYLQALTRREAALFVARSFLTCARATEMGINL